MAAQEPPQYQIHHRQQRLCEPVHVRARFDHPDAHGALREDLFALEPDADTIAAQTLIKINPSLEHATFDYDVVALSGGASADANDLERPTHAYLGWFHDIGFVAISNELPEREKELTKPRPLGELVADDGPFAGRRPLLDELLENHLLIALAPS